MLARGIAVETATTDDDGPGRRMAFLVGEPRQEELVGVAPLPRTDPLETLRPGGGYPTNSAMSLSTSFKPIRHYFPKRLEFYKVSPGFAWWVFLHVRDYDIVHIHALFSFTSVAAAWAARWAGVPYVVRPLGTLNRYGVEQRRPWLKQLSLKLVEGPILRHAAAVHFTAKAERVEALSLRIPMRGVVIPLGIEPSQPHETSALLDRFPELKNVRSLLVLSRLDPKKNVEGMLRAFNLLTHEWPDLRLVIAGDGEASYVVGLKELAVELGLANRVVWLGHIEGEQKAAAFAAAQVFVLPSFSENFGIAAAEALMAGLPCVLGKGVAIADEIAEAGAGIAVEPDPDSIAQGLKKLLSDNARWASMSGKAAALAREKYSVGAMGERLVRLYEEIVDREP
ncbi:MAG: glycosyltransferase [Rhodoferax sp.]|nr:glycosyltransferase [Rhodoferax sp.]